MKSFDDPPEETPMKKKALKNLRPRGGIGSIKEGYQKQISIDPRAYEFAELYALLDDDKERFDADDLRFRQLVVKLAVSEEVELGIATFERRQPLSELLKSWIKNNYGLFESEHDCQWLISSYLSFRMRNGNNLLTPAEIAEETGTAESTWRNKAAAGEIPGAIKKGKQWLLPHSVLRAKGILESS